VTGWLLDTNVLSELRRVRPNAKVVAFIKARPLDILYISSVTLRRFGSVLSLWLSRDAAPS
jgi:predicted nucleic acid-binding protein